MIFDRLFGKPKSEKPDEEEKVGAFERLRRGLGKTRDALTSLFGMGRKLDDDLLEEVETLLIESDFGPGLSMDLCDELRNAYKDRDFDSEEIVPFLKSIICNVNLKSSQQYNTLLVSDRLVMET